MEKEILKIGSSLAIIIPSPVAKSFHLKSGDRVRIEVEEWKITIQKTEKITPVKLEGIVKPSGFKLKDLRKLRREWTKSFEAKWKDL